VSVARSACSSSGCNLLHTWRRALYAQLLAFSPTYVNSQSCIALHRRIFAAHEIAALSDVSMCATQALPRAGGS